MIGNLDILTPKDFTKDHHKKGYKELGFTHVRVIHSLCNFHLTEPYEYKSTYIREPDQSGEYIVWDSDEPIAEFKDETTAKWFMEKFA